MRSPFDHLNGNELSAILSGSISGKSENSSLTNFIHRQEQRSLTSLSAGLPSAPTELTDAPGLSAPISNPVSQTPSSTLLTAIIQQQQREELSRAALLSHLLASNPGAQSQAASLAAVLYAKQISHPNATASNPITSSLGGISHVSNLLGTPTQAGQLYAASVAQLLKGQLTPGAHAIPNTEVSALAAHAGDVSATTALLECESSMSSGHQRKGRTGTFPQKLHQMLSDLERQGGGTDIASFLPHGRAFAIHKPRDFVKHVMPKYFRMSRFSSFQRQLNLYDFQRITEGPDKGSYYHELFVQGRPILSTMMKRNKIKGVKNMKKQQQNQLKDLLHDDAGDDCDGEGEDVEE